MGGPTTAGGQTYCLRWNNHKSNLVEILDALIKIESYVDCTIVVDDQVQFKAHRVVLAANSPYFQSILQDVPMDHCSILFPGVQAFEMRTLLEYMYTGEVNVTQSQIPKIMRIANQLEVKGLFDMADLSEKFNKMEESNSSPYTSGSAASTSVSSCHPLNHSFNFRLLNGKSSNDNFDSSQNISTSSNNNPWAVPTSSSSPTYCYKPSYPNAFLRSTRPVILSMDRNSSWPISEVVSNSITNATSVFSSVYETCSTMNTIKRKKMSSISSTLINHDTPILRNVLAQSTSADSSQLMHLVCPSINSEKTGALKQLGALPCENYCNEVDLINDKKTRNDEPHSPYTDRSFDDEGSDCPQTYLDNRMSSFGSQQQQKPEWKRYKQYTRTDILQAIECVRNGMSALQASRKYGVPSRTLYDKVKKLGITTSRPMNRTMKRNINAVGGNIAGYHYSHGHSKPDSPFEAIYDNVDREKNEEHHLLPARPNPAATLLDTTFLQHAFESRGGDIGGQKALHAMAIAAATHAAVNGISSSIVTNGVAGLPNLILAKKSGRTQSPVNQHNHDKIVSVEPEKELEVKREFEYGRLVIDHDMKKGKFPPEQNAENDYVTPKQNHVDYEEENNQVEDLSLSRKETISPRYNHHGVIISPKQ